MDATRSWLYTERSKIWYNIKVPYGICPHIHNKLGIRSLLITEPEGLNSLVTICQNVGLPNLD